MAKHEILGGKVQLFQRANSTNWQARASVEGKQFQYSTKSDSLASAKQIAEDWYLGLRGKARAGILKTEKTFTHAATQFVKEYAVITDGQRSVKWTEGHSIRLRVHLLPFFGKLGLSEITPGKVQEYRVRRMTVATPAEIAKTLDVSPASAGPSAAGAKGSPSSPPKPPARSTVHDEIVTLRLVLKTAIRHGWLSHLPDLSPPYKTQGKIEHRPWFSPEEYRQLYTATRAYARNPSQPQIKWNAEQVHDYVLFMANTGLRPDEAMPNNLRHKDIKIIDDPATGERILEIDVRGKRGYGACKSMPFAVKPYERLLARALPGLPQGKRARLKRGENPNLPPVQELRYPGPNDPVFPGSHLKLFNGVLRRANLKLDREGKPRTTYSLRHTYICMRLIEGADIYALAKNCRTSVEMIQKHYAAHIKALIDTTAINVMRPKASKNVLAAIQPSPAAAATEAERKMLVANG